MEEKEIAVDREALLENLRKNPRVILGLDVSTACIGASIIIDDGSEKPKIAKITHYSPKVPGKIKGIEALFLRKKLFQEEFLKELKDYYITDVVIEEPLLSSNNSFTVATLLRFNGMISDSVYNTLGIVPCFISSYDARTFSFPELMSIRKFNKKGNQYPVKHVKKAISDNHLVLFGSYPFDVDKKMVMMDMVNDMYDDIEWIYNKGGKLKKENFDACDSLVCALAYANINHHGIEEASIDPESIRSSDDGKNLEIDYDVTIWDRRYNKKIILDESVK